MADSVEESAWARGWDKTKKKWTSWQFFVLDAVGAVVIGNIFSWQWGLAVVGFGMLCVWIGATASTPYHQRNEARLRIKELEAKLRKSNLFDVSCPTTSLGLPVNKLGDGKYVASVMSLGFKPISIIHRGELTTITRLSMTPRITFIREDNKGWEINDSIQLKSGSNPLASPRATSFSWDTSNPQVWELVGLPLTLAEDESLTLPMIMISVKDGNDFGSRLDNGETCVLKMSFAIRTDKGYPLVSDQQIFLTRSDAQASISRGDTTP